ncbi:MAG TPA: septal ring lytic transglycosylase RlpA family protein [Acidimicrobiales bacterium]|nr:septal ring lytic transglycosylase RlpA family protein [Acidimicrobiales bacterium]
MVPRRAWLLVNIAVTLALLPALFPDDGPSTTAVRAGSGTVELRPLVADALAATLVSAVPETTTTAPAPVAAAAPATTTTTAAPKPATTTTTAARSPTTAAPTTAAPAPPPTEPPAPPPATGSESGRATWYDWKPGICAHKTLPMGTVVTVNAVNGRSVQCTVGDRGPFVEGYIIDLHWQEFEQLTSRDAGRIDVTIHW